MQTSALRRACPHETRPRRPPDELAHAPEVALLFVLQLLVVEPHLQDAREDVVLLHVLSEGLLPEGSPLPLQPLDDHTAAEVRRGLEAHALTSLPPHADSRESNRRCLYAGEARLR